MDVQLKGEVKYLIKEGIREFLKTNSVAIDNDARKAINAMIKSMTEIKEHLETLDTSYLETNTKIIKTEVSMDNLSSKVEDAILEMQNILTKKEVVNEGISNKKSSIKSGKDGGS